MNSNYVVSKILIDLEEYTYLKSLESELTKKNEEIKNLLKSHSVQHFKKDSAQTNFKGENSIQEDLEQSSHEDKNKFGKGSEEQGLLPEKPDHIPPEEPSTSELISPLLKTNSKPNNDIDENILIKKVPQRFHPRAKQLLAKLLSDPNEVSFDPSGTLIIDNESIPNSNLFVIFPKLYVGSVRQKIPGFQELLNKIAELDLAPLINKKITKGFSTSKVISNRPELLKKIKENKQWWLIGE